MADYTREDFERDLEDPAMPHIKDKKHFQSFYNELGTGEVQQNLKFPDRMKWVKVKPKGRVLELGCHSGYDLIHWLTKYPELTAIGVDISNPLLEAAKRKAEEARVSDRLVLLNSFIENLPTLGAIGNDITDIVLTETLEHVQEPISVLRATCEILDQQDKECTLWITVPAARWGNYSHVRGINKEQLEKLFEDSGFPISKFTIEDFEVRGRMTHFKGKLL